MSPQSDPTFEGGKNIAMKIPPHVFHQTVSFYQDVLRLPVVKEGDNSIVFKFGANHLWLDKVDHLSQAEIWLEVNTDDIDAAADYLDYPDIKRRDEIENLPEEIDGFWISNPANIIHLVYGTE